MIRKDKEEKWKEYVDDLDTKTNPREVWRAIRNLDGRYAPRKDNEVLVVGDKGYVEDRDKAKQFAKTYKMQSRIPRNQTDKVIKQSNREYLNRRPETTEEHEDAITREDLNRSFKEAKFRKASGDDDIPHEFLKNLGEKARKYILHMYNRTWNGEEVPQKWRRAVIKPLLKDGKDPSWTTSYRPISLTACLGKNLEKIIADRLNGYLEENNLLNANQAGFRSERCTADQVLKLVQTATDAQQRGRRCGHSRNVFRLRKSIRQGVAGRIAVQNDKTRNSIQVHQIYQELPQRKKDEG